MRNWRLLLASALLACPAITGLHAQTAISAAGGNTSGGGGTVSFTVGQIDYTTISSVNHSVAQGVQQPFEISVVTTIEEATGINLSVSVYPNPTTDYLQLKVESEKLKDLSFQLFDLSGKLLQSEKIRGNQTSINMSNLAPATYFVKVFQGNEEVKTFKIIKN